MNWRTSTRYWSHERRRITMLEWCGITTHHCSTRSTLSSRTCGARQSYQVLMNLYASFRKQARNLLARILASVLKPLRMQRRRKERLRERGARPRTLICSISSRISLTSRGNCIFWPRNLDLVGTSGIARHFWESFDIVFSGGVWVVIKGAKESPMALLVSHSHNGL